MSVIEQLKKNLQKLGLSLWVLLLALISAVLGTWVRYANLWNEGFHYDTVVTQYDWARYATQHGLIHFWQDYNLNLDYPPLNLLYLNCIQYVATHLLGGSTAAFVIILKSWYWLVDLFLLVLAWIVATKFELSIQSKVLIVSALYSIPSYWLNSAVWGQGDTLHAVLVLLSSIIFFSKLRYRGLLSGIILALAVWFKLQAILVLPIFLLFWAAQYRVTLWNHWKWMILTTFAGIALLFYPVKLVNSQFYDHHGLGDGYQDFTEFLSPLSYVTIAGIVVYLFVLMGGFTRRIIQSKGKFLQLDQFIIGFLAVTTIIIAIFGSLNPIRIIRVTIGATLLDGQWLTGAANTMSIGRWVEKYNSHDVASWVPTALIWSATVFFLGVLWYFIRTVYQAHRTDLASFLLIVAVFIIEFFTFSTSRVHSRYAHIGLVLFTLVALKFRLRVRGWIGIVVVHIAYIWNQAYVFPSDVNNLEPKWLLEFGRFGGQNIFFVILSLMILGSLLLLTELRYQLRARDFDSTLTHR